MVHGQEYQGADQTLADAFSEVPQYAFKQPSATHEGQRESEDGMELVFGGKMVPGLGLQWYVPLKVNFVQSSQMKIYRLRARSGYWLWFVLGSMG